MSLFAPAVLGWLALQSSAPASRAADRDLLASVMPPGAVAYVEVPRPAELWSAVRELGLDERVTALPVVDRVLNGPTAMVLAAVRNVLGGDIAGSLLAASDGGVAVALVPSPSKRALASVLAVRSRDPVALARARDGVARLGGLRVDGAWDESRVETTRHGDVEIISTRNSRHHAIAGEWLLASDDRAQLVEALDRRRSAKSGSLAEQPRFAQARSGANDGPTAAFAWVDVDGFATLRPELRDSAKTLEPIPALLFGGLRRAAIGAPWIAARMSLDVAAPGAVRLSMQSGASFEGLEAERAVFLPERTPAAVLDAPRAIATLTLRRDGASFWNHRDALVAPELDADFARFNSFVGLVFGARNVDEDVLPKLHPIAQLVAARQTYAGMAAAPPARIPAFALVLRSRDTSRRFLDGFHRAFQTFLSLVAADRAQKGKSAPGLAETRDDDTRIVYAAFPEAGDGESPGNESNFSPALFTQGEHVVISSSLELARDLARVLRAPEVRSGGDDAAVLDRLEIGADELRAALRENLEPLVAKQVLDEGKDRKQAEADLRAILDALSLASRLRVETLSRGPRLEMRAVLELAPPAPRRVAR